MTGKHGLFTRVDGNKWAIATHSTGDAHTTVDVERTDGELIPMPLGVYIGPHLNQNKFKGMHTYKIAKGGKAPTSGKMGRNPHKKRGYRPTAYLDPVADPYAKRQAKRHGEPEPSTPDPVADPVAAYAARDPIPSEPDPFEPKTEEVPSAVDLSEYAKTAWVKGEFRDELLSVVCDEVTRLEKIIQENTPTIVNIVKGTPNGTVLKTITGQHAALPALISNLMLGNHTYLVGPAGSGKTHLALSASQALDRELSVVGAMLTKHEVIGYQDASGRYVTTAARDAFEFGKLLLWDEVDSSAAPALVAVNAMLSNSLYTFPDRTVERHKDFVVIAAGNTYGTGADRSYVGRLQLDGATLDRFDFLTVGYDLKLERTLALSAYAEHGGADLEEANGWVTFVVKVRDAISSLGQTHIVSPRASINGAKKLAVGQSRSEILDQTIWKGIGSDARQQITNIVGEECAA